MAPRDEAKCSCEWDEIQAHICPYSEEIEDDDKLCYCCEHCETECARDI